MLAVGVGLGPLNGGLVVELVDLVDGLACTADRVGGGDAIEQLLLVGQERRALVRVRGLPAWERARRRLVSAATSAIDGDSGRWWSCWLVTVVSSG